MMIIAENLWKSILWSNTSTVGKGNQNHEELIDCWWFFWVDDVRSKTQVPPSVILLWKAVSASDESDVLKSSSREGFSSRNKYATNWFEEVNWWSTVIIMKNYLKRWCSKKVGGTNEDFLFYLSTGAIVFDLLEKLKVFRRVIQVIYNSLWECLWRVQWMEVD